ncbi:glycosyltransferase family 4 protein (plasmid) [Phyllobacterium sp. 628]|uniref:glycosyltransferase family 4 protein n=1 Tax=Phyllobacterium sp. 628 TaxID=2718938 RepID=UPI0016627B7A|nr:glycosyltransferase family 1 protein [Phyllobacterium sp. 628]QND50598.1 glycosyltransferase family 4 protein [Phyllobacterium sp. 628]
MVKTILYDGLNLSMQKGTGVATYTRGLIQTARNLDYQTGIVHSVQGKLPKDPMLREVVLFDDNALRKLGPVALGRRWLRRQIAAPLGIKPTQIPLTGTVITKSLQGNVMDSEFLYANNDVFALARQHFKVFGKSLPLSFDKAPDLFHTTYPLPLRARKSLNICTIHDLVPLRLPYLTEDNKRYHYKLVRHLAKTADHIVTVSETSRQDIIKILNVDEKRVTNTYQAVHVPLDLRNKPQDVAADEIAGIFNLDWKKYFLFFGAFEPKKNLSRLVEAYLSAKVDIPLIIVGAPGWKGDQTQLLIDDERFRFYSQTENRIVPGRRIHRFDFVSYSLLISLVRGARAVLFPSLYEGFGLPVLESMQLGTPVLTSTEGSVPEIAGDAALLIDPYDTDSLRNAVKALANDNDLCDHLAKLGPKQAEFFSPERYHQAVGALYDGLFNGSL